MADIDMEMNDSPDNDGQDAFDSYIVANCILHCDPIAHWTKELGGCNGNLARIGLEFLSAPGK